ncbi:MAG TPA: hypothetical protein VK658_18220 [Chryseolinea sp.]|nr:hypothetical protein [Chryseolinea sp.]
MTSRHPTIQLIHAADAPQHTGELKSILERMKSQQRISSFSSLDLSLSQNNVSFNSEDGQGIIVLLTNEIEQVRKDIETFLSKVSQEKNNIKLIEIIVDNLPYHNSFISFPQDLMPIRRRDDMNTVWDGIEADLQKIFPKPPPDIVIQPVPPVKDSRKLQKLFVICILSSMICALLFTAIASQVALVALIGLFGFSVPILVFVWQRKSLMRSMPAPPAEVPVNWRKLIVDVLVGLIFFFSIALGIAAITNIMGLQNPFLILVLAIAATLPLISSRAKKIPAINAPLPTEKVSQTKKYLKLFGFVLLYLLLSTMFWGGVVQIVARNINGYYEQAQANILIVLTTASLLAIKYD